MSTADALMTLCPFDVSVSTVRIRVTIPEDTYWSICCYGPNSDNVFAMNDLQALQKIGRKVVYVLHCNSVKVAMAGNEVSVPLKSSRGIVLIRTGVPDPHDAPSLSLLALNQRLASVAVSARSDSIERYGDRDGDHVNGTQKDKDRDDENDNNSDRD
jgi:uncharacterized membrane protein